MANTIVIEKGNRQLQNVEQITPDTRVNQQAVIKYPATDLNNGMSAQTWTEDTLDGEPADDPIEFVNPHEYVDPDAEADTAPDEGDADDSGSDNSGSGGGGSEASGT